MSLVYKSCFGHNSITKDDFMIENNMTDVNMQLQLHKYIWSPDKKGV